MAKKNAESVSREAIQQQVDILTDEREQCVMNLHRIDGALFILNKVLDPSTVATAPTADAFPMPVNPQG